MNWSSQPRIYAIERVNVIDHDGQEHVFSFETAGKADAFADNMKDFGFTPTRVSSKT